MAHEWVPAFLKALGEVPNVCAAAEAAGIHHDTPYKYRDINPEFAAQWQSAIDRSTENLVGEVYRRAKDGVDKPVFQGGSEVGKVREYSDVLAIFLLKAHRPNVYREKVKVNHAGDDDGPIEVNVNILEDATDRLKQWRLSMKKQLLSLMEEPHDYPANGD